jgi:predicted O-methyltransferase YrrM
MDGAVFLRSLHAQGSEFDLIFADTWPGKYTDLDNALSLLKIGGLYVVDDMLPQPNWPEDHPPKVAALISLLDGRDDLRLARLDWSTGLMLGARVR